MGEFFARGKKKNNISWITIYYWIAWGDERTVIGGVVETWRLEVCCCSNGGKRRKKKEKRELVTSGH